MTYNITGTFPTTQEAISAAINLEKEGFIKQFPGFARNTKFQPESLVEDHFIDENEISVYTPNLNRAHKAKNILTKFGAEIKKVQGIYYNKIQNTKKSPNATLLSANRKKLQKRKLNN